MEELGDPKWGSHRRSSGPSVLSPKWSPILDQAQTLVNRSLKPSSSRKPSSLHASLYPEHGFPPFIPGSLALRHPQKAAYPSPYGWEVLPQVALQSFLLQVSLFLLLPPPPTCLTTRITQLFNSPIIFSLPYKTFRELLMNGKASLNNYP